MGALWLTSVTAVVAIGACGAALADDSRKFGAVICTSEAGAAWSEKARGTLTRTKSKDGVSYELKAGEHTLRWSFVAAPPRGTTVTGPGYLMDRFAAPAKAGDSAERRRQSLYADGEIWEYAPPSALILLIRSKCPARRTTAS